MTRYRAKTKVAEARPSLNLRKIQNAQSVKKRKELVDSLAEGELNEIGCAAKWILWHDNNVRIAQPDFVGWYWTLPENCAS